MQACSAPNVVFHTALGTGRPQSTGSRPRKDVCKPGKARSRSLVGAVDVPYDWRLECHNQDTAGVEGLRLLTLGPHRAVPDRGAQVQGSSGRLVLLWQSEL